MQVRQALCSGPSGGESEAWIGLLRHAVMRIVVFDTGRMLVDGAAVSPEWAASEHLLLKCEVSLLQRDRVTPDIALSSFHRCLGMCGDPAHEEGSSGWGVVVSTLSLRVRATFVARSCGPG